MAWEEAIVARLLQDPAVAALVGQRIEWDDLAPDTALPAITLQIISDPRPQTHDGFDQFRGSRVQVNGLGTKKAQAKAVREAAIAALVPEGEAGGVTFLRAFVDGGRSDAEQTPTRRICRERTDLIIWHN